MNEKQILFHPIVAGKEILDDWFKGYIPGNIEVGENSVIDSASGFKHFFSKLPIGLKIGSNVTVWRTSFATEQNGFITIGEYCYIAGASLVSAQQITIGSRV